MIDVRHEQTAAHAADGWARVTGQPGVAIVTAGPGLTDAVTGVASAHARQHPDGHHRRAGPAPLRRHGLAAGHEPRRAHAADHQVGGLGARRRAGSASTSRTAFRIATTGRPGPVFLEMPLDLLFDTYDEAKIVVSDQLPHRGGHRRRSRATSSGPSTLLARRERPVASSGSQLLLVARGARRIRSSSTRFGMPVYVNGQARGSPAARRPALLPRRRARTALKRRRRRAHLRHAARLPHRLRPRLAHQSRGQADPGRPRRRASSAATAPSTSASSATPAW